MSSCGRCQKMMVGALYQELPSRQQHAFDKHLATCPICAEEYQQLLWTLDIMGRRQAPAMDPAYWEGFWDRLSGRLEPGRRKALRPDWRSWFPPAGLPVRPVWISVAAAVLLIATGVYIGRSIYVSQPDGAPAAARAEVIDPAVVAEFNSLASRYLERSRVLLLGLDNFDTEYDDPAVIDFPRQQMISQELLYRGRELRSHQVAASNQGLQYLIDQIELVLLQLANSEGQNLKWTIQLLQEGIDKNAILLKITLTELGPDGEGGPEEPGLPEVKGSALFI